MAYRLFASSFIAFVAVFFLLLVVACDASAQQRQFGHQSNRDDVMSLPSWAAPQENVRRTPSREQQSSRFSVQQQQGCGTLNAPDDCTLPPPPSQVPLGGLEWLAVAGGAYAMNRLRREDSSEDDDDSDRT